MVNGMEDVQTVLAEYGLTAEFIEPVSPRVCKVYTNYGIFALKQLDVKRSRLFTDQMLALEEKGFRSFVPIYRTNSGEFFSGGMQARNAYYYLMPWLQYDQAEERDQKHEYLFKETARLHERTVQEIKISSEDIRRHYENTKKKWEKEKLSYEQFVDQAEKEWYLSPFELQAVTCFSETISAVNFAIDRLGDWYEAMKEKSDYRIVMNHGSLSIHHFLYNDAGSGFFTNFEKASVGPPQNDLIGFYARTFRSYPKSCPECLDWFYTYHKAFPLYESENSLFLSYMAYPAALYKVLNRYQTNQRLHEKEECAHLLKAYWQMKNTEPFVMKVHQIEQEKKFQTENGSAS